MDPKEEARLIELAKQNAHIPDAEIKRDIKKMRSRIREKVRELRFLRAAGTSESLGKAICREVDIKQYNEFIGELNFILNYRERMKTMEKIDKKIVDLKKIRASIEALEEQETKLRTEIFEDINKQNLGQYKNDVATVSVVERVSFKFARKPEEIVADLKSKNLSKYLVEVPEEVIPARTELSKQFEVDLKAGAFEVEGVEVVRATSPMIRFNK